MTMHANDSKPTPFTRREFLACSGGGLGLLALGDLLALDAGGSLPQDAAKPWLLPKAPAKSVIWLFLYGGPSAMDLFDPKPELDRGHGKKPPAGIKTFFKDNGNLMRTPYSFKQYGQSGAWVSEKQPALAQHVDDLAFLKAVHCDSNNHAPALFHLNTGMSRVGFPSTGAWVQYGLGTASKNLPNFVVMYDPRGGPIGGPQNWGSGFLPTNLQGVPFRSEGVPILDLARAGDRTDAEQRRQLELLRALNAAHAAEHPEARELEARIKSAELAYAMQSAAPEATDIADESEATQKLYGLDNPRTKVVGRQCLVARRLVERGVRFVQIYSGGGHQQDSWDAHYGLRENHDLHCAETDVPFAGLLADLKQRGLLDSTLVVWGGEFGRMPMSQGTNGGRDHNPDGFLMWLAGGGVKGGVSHGSTDEIGWKAADGAVSVNDLHATILHCLGLDHEKLTYLHNGRDYRLTDVAGTLIRPILRSV